MTFASDLKHFRARLGVTQRAAAKGMGVPIGTYRDWEQDRSQPTEAVRHLIRQRYLFDKSSHSYQHH